MISYVMLIRRIVPCEVGLWYPLQKDLILSRTTIRLEYITTIQSKLPLCCAGSYKQDMATELKDITDTKGNPSTDAPHIEAGEHRESPLEWIDRSELTELTPVEAFKWNVEGDQSPCECQINSRYLVALTDNF